MRKEKSITKIPDSLLSVKERLVLIQDLYKTVMQDGIHYGRIEGCGEKPTLLQAGADLINTLLGLSPIIKEQSFTDLGNDHREYRFIIQLVNSESRVIAEGVGSASTKESKYRYRKASKKCPRCGKDAIIQGKKEYGGGWLCWTKKGGCSAKFEEHDEAITSQPSGLIENESIPDIWNTVLKMAYKRALVCADIRAAQAGNIFTQDIEDTKDNAEYIDIPHKKEPDFFDKVILPAIKNKRLTSELFEATVKEINKNTMAIKTSGEAREAWEFLAESDQEKLTIRINEILEGKNG